jgi:hypothetical protein
MPSAPVKISSRPVACITRRVIPLGLPAMTATPWPAPTVRAASIALSPLESPDREPGQVEHQSPRPLLADQRTFRPLRPMRGSDQRTRSPVPDAQTAAVPGDGEQGAAAAPQTHHSGERSVAGVDVGTGGPAGHGILDPDDGIYSSAGDSGPVNPRQRRYASNRPAMPRQRDVRWLPILDERPRRGLGSPTVPAGGSQPTGHQPVWGPQPVE